jgi:hypothetical protein
MEKKRRAKKMEATEVGFLNTEDIQESTVEVKNHGVLRVRDYTEMTREFTGIVKENYLNGVQLGVSLLEGNSKMINAQSEQLLAAQKAYYTTLTTEIVERFSTEAVNFWNYNSRNHLQRVISFRKVFSNVVMNTSDRFMKEALLFMEKSVDKTLANFNAYLKAG